MKFDYREATETDVPGLVALLADDDLGAAREDISQPLNPVYREAFRHIDADANNELIVVECDGQLAGMLQLSFIPYLTHRGTWRCLIEGVRVARAYRGQGLGGRLIEWAIARARERGCGMAQLTSDKQRPDALRFYQSHGFKASHEGFKLKL